MLVPPEAVGGPAAPPLGQRPPHRIGRARARVETGAEEEGKDRIMLIAAGGIPGMGHYDRSGHLALGQGRMGTGWRTCL